MFLQITSCHNERVHSLMSIIISLLTYVQLFEATAKGYEFTFKALEPDLLDSDEVPPIQHEFNDETTNHNVDQLNHNATETDFIPDDMTTFPPSPHASTPPHSSPTSTCLSSPISCPSTLLPSTVKQPLPEPTSPPMLACKKVASSVQNVLELSKDTREPKGRLLHWFKPGTQANTKAYWD